MGNLNYIVFGGVDSRDYGIYISGEGVFNAPERDVEVVNIPGKDGDLLIDRGRFLNIQVTYPGFNFEPDLSTFAERLRAFRAALASQIGYQKLEDSFHPDEFRMATFRSGLDINPVMYNTASTFDIVFDCKPQRFLKSGEEEITIGEWGETQTVSGSIATFEAESNTGIKSLVVDIDPAQSGTGDPSPSNVRPISGYGEVTASVAGKNLCPSGQPNEMIEVNLLKGWGVFASAKESTRILLYDKNQNQIDFWAIQAPYENGARYYRNFFVVDDTRYVKFEGSSEYQIEFAVQNPTPYTPYQGSTITKSLGRTVYGGTLDIVIGVLTVTHKAVDMGDLTYTHVPLSNNRHGFVTPSIADLKAEESMSVPIDAIASMYKAVTYAGSWVNGNMSYNGAVGNKTIIFINNAYADASAFKTAMAGQIVVYPLATPIEIQLTPTEVKTLLGNNNIWADSGEVTVEFGADPNILVNPTPFEALPIFEVVGTGSLTVGNTTVTITGDSTQDIFIDSDIMEAYEDDNGAIIPRNDRINLSGTDFPKLGEETRVESNGLTSVKITPRWWTI